MEWTVLPFRRFADFSGRSRRREYWMFQLLNLIVVIAGVALLVATAPEPGKSGLADETGATSGALVILFLAYVVVMFIPQISVEVRRFHDQGKSGWNWLWRLAPFGGLIILYFMVQPGTHGPNEYGEDPLDGGLGEVFG